MSLKFYRWKLDKRLSKLKKRIDQKDLITKEIWSVQSDPRIWPSSPDFSSKLVRLYLRSPLSISTKFPGSITRILRFLTTSQRKHQLMWIFVLRKHKNSKGYEQRTQIPIKPRTTDCFFELTKFKNHKGPRHQELEFRGDLSVFDQHSKSLTNRTIVLVRQNNNKNE